MEPNQTAPKAGAKFNPLVVVGIVAVVAIGAIILLNAGKNSTPEGATPQTGQVQQPAPSQSSQSADLGTTPTPTPSGAMAQGNIKEFTITGSNFKFDPPQMTVNKGDTVKITFKNSQGFHNFALDEFQVASKTIPAGQSDTVQFVADKTGSFQYYCSVGQHRAMGMVGTLTVQ